MAKKSKRRPIRISKIAATTSSSATETQPYHASNIIHPNTPTAPTQKRRCSTARQKHTIHLRQQEQPTIPTLADRFHALPAELRCEIFSFLLVQPVKWQLPHLTTTSTDGNPCPLTTHPWSPYPEIWSEDTQTCIRCRDSSHAHTRVPLWRHLQPPDPGVPDWHRHSGGRSHVVWRNPWRSQWAPKVRNPFLCSECWDLEFRPRPHPAMEEVGGKRHLRCLCARRRDLGVLLVCKKWYEEAGAVLYSRNTFAFESAAVFKAFVAALPLHWREKVSGVSLMAYHPSDPSGPVEEASGWEGNRKILPAFSLLHKLPRLRYLELDAHFLTRTKTAHRLLKLSHPNVMRVCFTLHNPVHLHRAAKPSEWIWPEYHSARLMVGGFAEEVARAIKGQRPRCGLRSKKPAALSEAVEREEGREEWVMTQTARKDGRVGRGNVFFAGSGWEYGRLWWEEQKHHENSTITRSGGGTTAHLERGGNGLHAYISTELTHLSGVRAASMEEHWRDWAPSSLRGEDFGIRHPALWREKAGWDVLFKIQAEEFLDDSLRERRGWEFLNGIEL